jgi:carboxylesterase
LEAVTVPVVILQAQEDDMTSPRNAALVYDTIASKEKRLVLLDDCYHVMTVDKQKHAVVTSLADFFAIHASRKKVPPGILSENIPEYAACPRPISIPLF